MTFWGGLKFCYREGWAFLVACPLLALVPIIAEFVQHAVEMQVGMYDGREGAIAAEDNQLRMIFGMVKILSLILMGYWAIRFYAGDRDAKAARTFDLPAVKRYIPVVIFSLGFSALQIFALPENPVVVALILIAGFIVPIFLIRWYVAAPLDIPIGPIASLKVMLPQSIWAIGFVIAASLPLMIPHYLLGGAAIVIPVLAVKWGLLIVDSLLVGYLGAVMMAANWVAATRKTPLADG